MARVFVVDEREFPDPAPGDSLEAVRRRFADFFPDVATAEAVETPRGDDIVVEFRRRVGTKGVAEDWKCPHDCDFFVNKDMLPEGPSFPADILPFVTLCEVCRASYHEVWIERGAPYAQAVAEGRYPASLEEALTQDRGIQTEVQEPE